MASSTLLVLAMQVLFLAPLAPGLSTITDKVVMRRESRVEDTAAYMDAGGRMQLSPTKRLLTKMNKAQSDLQIKFPFYHTSDELRSEVVRLSKKCAHLNVTTLTESNVSIDLISCAKLLPPP
jgi:hypothetical protein